MISVIIPAYNAAQFIHRSLHSVFNQQLQNFEVIVVDDGSTDDTQTAVKTYCEINSKLVTFIRIKNQGPGVARQVGVDASKGALIAFLDSDDEWKSDHLAAGESFLRTHTHIDWLYGSTTVVDDETDRILDENFLASEPVPPSIISRPLENGEYFELLNTKAIAHAINKHVGAGLQTSIIRRTVFGTTKIPDTRVGEDQIFVIAALTEGYKLAFSKRPSTIYRVRAESISAAGKDLLASIRANLLLVESFKLLLKYDTLGLRQKQLVRRRLAKTHAWLIAERYRSLGDYQNATKHLQIALRHTPFNISIAKSFCTSFFYSYSQTDQANN